MKYKREIDGLRALAVLPVMLFHAGFEMFSGGFVGVDVFFVISGYLITNIILDELERGKFSVVNFYERRARRILPALSLVMAVSLLLAWLWMHPGDMKDFSRSLIAVPLFASNILFWKESGYFDTAAELKPLLHTWSLAVEEQYYVFFPLFLMLAWKVGRRWIVLMLVIVAFASLVLAQLDSVSAPMSAFYLLPTRGWELLVGSFAAFYASKVERVEFSRGVCEVGGCFGVVLILYAIFAYSKTTPFPGVYALVPTAGAALIILFASQKTTIGRVIGNRAFVGVGLISYSAYLWHQPLFAFARYKGMGETSLTMFALLILATLVLAYFTWRYVEAPFRSKQQFSRQQVFSLSAAVSIIFVAFGLFGHAMQGFEYRLDEQQRALLAFNAYEVKSVYRKGDCFLSLDESYKQFKPECVSLNPRNSILIWGDSHAAAMSFGFREAFPNTTQYTASGCPPMLDAVVSSRPMCKGINSFIAGEIKRLQPRTILLHANWIAYDDLMEKPQLGIQKTIDYIRSNSPGSKIIIIGGVPQFYPTLPSFMWQQHQHLTSDVHLKSYIYSKLEKSDREFAQLSQKYGVEFFSALSAFCQADSCMVTSSYGSVVMPIAWDYGHLTAAGSTYLAKKFAQIYTGND